MSIKFTTTATIQGVLNGLVSPNAFFLLLPSAAQVAAARGQFPQSEFRALVGSDGSFAFLHLSGYPNTNDDSFDIQGNQVIKADQMLAQVAELQPWLSKLYSHVGITVGGLYYARGAGLLGTVNIPSTTATAQASAQYLANYGALMGPPVSSV